MTDQELNEKILRWRGFIKLNSLVQYRLEAIAQAAEEATLKKVGEIRCQTK